VATVILSAVVPTLVANAFFLPRHLIDKVPAQPDEAAAIGEGSGAPVRRAS
jgi:hypothetical protein